MAFRLFSQAAENGNASAILELASCYLHGKGTTADLDKSNELFKMALELLNK